MTVRRTQGIDYIGVGVGAVILNELGEVLLLLRKNCPEAGQWTIPGGAVEWFETCADAIKRECREEIGLDVEVVGILTVVDHIVKEDQEHWVSIEYLVKIPAGEVTNADKNESEELRWFPIDALPDRMTQPTKEALQCYLDMFVDRTAAPVQPSVTTLQKFEEVNNSSDTPSVMMQSRKSER